MTLIKAFDSEAPLKPARELVHCSKCGGQRNHKVIHRFIGKFRDSDAEIDATEHYEVCQCLGCEEVSFRTVLWTSEDVDDIPLVRVYPEPKKASPQTMLAWDLHLLPIKVGRVYGETIEAYRNDLYILAGGGLRAIVEAVCLDKKVSGNKLADKIDEFVNLNLLARPQADLLHEERYLGNAALHEIEPPAKADIQDGLAIIENLLSTIYLMTEKAERLKASREKKSKTKKKWSREPLR